MSVWAIQRTDGWLAIDYGWVTDETGALRFGSLEDAHAQLDRLHASGVAARLTTLCDAPQPITVHAPA